jgi:hypothetical protein
VKTKLLTTTATASVEGGADTAVWLATDAPHSLSGKFFRRRSGTEFVGTTNRTLSMVNASH